MGIQNKFILVEHPQENEPDEAINKMILNDIKKKLKDAKRW